MLTDSSLALITFINLFFVPFISLRIYYKRHSITWTFDFDIVYRYAFCCILNLPFTRILCSIAEKTLGIICLADSTKYTIFALITAVILPFLIEITEHYVDINVIITYHKKEKTKDNEEQP